jgi:uncharacterized protein DUF748
VAKIKLKRWIVIAVAIAAGSAVVVSLGLHFAAQQLKSKIEQALGPESEIESIALGWSAIEIRSVRIKGPKAWPAADTLRARRIVIEPDLRALVSASIRVKRITVEDAYVSVLRARDGRLRLVPSLLEAQSAKITAPPVNIHAIELRGGVLEFFDATVRQPAHRVRLHQLQATIEDLNAPDLAGRTQIRIDGVIQGVHHQGTLSVRGWSELSNKNSEIATTLRGVDLVAFEPYLVKASETGVRRGKLDLVLNSTVRKNVLRAPGTLTLTDLELASSGGALNTFMGMPRDAVIAALRNRDGKIRIQFTLEGNLNDPKFSLNESFARRMASSLGETLGLSVEGLARGVGNAARGVGEAVMKLFGQ